jgi:hypothetical protein
MVDALQETAIGCPYCGEQISLLIDGSAAPQQYIEDCEICCRPIEIHLSIDSDGQIAVTASHENE